MMKHATGAFHGPVGRVRLIVCPPVLSRTRPLTLPSQMIWVWSVSLPLTLLNSTEVNPGLSARDVVGGIMFVVGFVFELGSDVQKDIFKVSEP